MSVKRHNLRKTSRSPLLQNQAACSKSFDDGHIYKAPDQLSGAFSHWQQQHSGYANSPSACFGLVYAGLRRSQHEEGYEPFRDMLTDHIFRSMPIAAGTEVLGTILKERRLHSIRTAAQEAGCSAAHLRAILVSADGLNPNLKEIVSEGALIPAALISPLLAKIRASISTQRLLRDLSLRPEQLVSLRAACLLKPSFETKDLRLWDPREAWRVLHQVSGGEVIDLPAPGRTELGAALARSGHDFGAILVLSLTTGTPWLALRKDRTGFAALVVREDEVAALRSTRVGP